MKRLLILILLVIAPFGVVAQSDSRLKTFDFVWNTINERYYDPEFNGADWRKLREQYRMSIAAAADDEELYSILDRLAGELRDSHTRVSSPAKVAARKTGTQAGTGITLRAINAEFVVAAVVPDSPAARAGVRPGMVLSAIGSSSIDDAVRQADADVGQSSSVNSRRLRLLSRLLAGEPGSSVTLKLREGDSAQREFVVVRGPFAPPPPFEARMLDAKVAYVRFSKFEEAVVARAEKAVRRFRKASAMIVDLRGNPGGDGDAGLRFIGAFLRKTTPIAKVITRTGKPVVPGMPSVLEAGGGRGVKFDGRLVILVDERTASVSELIATALQENGRATVVGTPTCGCVLAFLDFIPLPGGGDMTISEMDFKTANGTRIEGRGVVPDNPVEPTVADLLAGRDTVLEFAKARLKNR